MTWDNNVIFSERLMASIYVSLFVDRRLRMSSNILIDCSFNHRLALEVQKRLQNPPPQAKKMRMKPNTLSAPFKQASPSMRAYKISDHLCSFVVPNRWRISRCIWTSARSWEWTRPVSSRLSICTRGGTWLRSWLLSSSWELRSDNNLEISNNSKTVSY